MIMDLLYKIKEYYQLQGGSSMLDGNPRNLLTQQGLVGKPTDLDTAYNCSILAE